jgi:hypothetical protein
MSLDYGDNVGIALLCFQNVSRVTLIKAAGAFNAKMVTVFLQLGHVKVAQFCFAVYAVF